MDRFRRKLLILWDEDSVTGIPKMAEVAQRNRCVMLAHIEQHREVALPTRVRALSPNCPELPPNCPPELPIFVSPRTAVPELPPNRQVGE